MRGFAHLAGRHTTDPEARGARRSGEQGAHRSGTKMEERSSAGDAVMRLDDAIEAEGRSMKV